MIVSINLLIQIKGVPNFKNTGSAGFKVEKSAVQEF